MNLPPLSLIRSGSERFKPRPVRSAILLFSTLLFADPSSAAVLAGWDVHALAGGTNNFGTSPLAASATDANLTVGGLTRGSGSLTSGSGAARGWGGTNWNSASAAAAVTANQFATFTAAANAGYQVSYTSISKFDYRRSATGAASGTVQYQLGSGAFTDISTVSYSVFTSGGSSIAAIDLSGIAALQNVPASTTVTFRVVNYGGTATGGTWYVFDVANTTANDLEISGTVSVASGVVNGACGSSNGQTVAVAPSINLCTTGTASTVTGTGPWAWSCASTTGGTTASCAASKTAISTGGPFTIFHMNDVHARITPHKWIINQHSKTPGGFEDVGGAPYVAGEMLSLTAGKPDSLVLDGGDISEGNPLGDMNGTATGSYGNGGLTTFYSMLANKLKLVPGRSGRGIDALVVGNHDVRDLSYMTNMEQMHLDSGIPVISANVRDISTHQPHFPATTTVTVNGTKIGIVGYTTPSAVVGASLASTIEVVQCGWDTTPTGAANAVNACHIADYVNDLRNNQHCDVVILLTHDGHANLVDPTTPVLADTLTAKVPEIAVTGHWHTWSDTVWQPTALNYKTIFTESASYMKFIGELNVNADGSYASATQHVLRNADITPDPDALAFVENLRTIYNSVNPGHPVDEVVGYTADNLMLDNDMKWWSADEYPWNGNNTAGQWITDAMQWKCGIVFGQCDFALEAGGGVRADIPAGQVTYKQVYETFPWADDVYYRVNMTGQEVVNFIKDTHMDAGFSGALDVTAFDGIPTSIKFNGQPIDLNHIYTVGINNYMYDHPPSGYTWSDTTPMTSTVLVRDSLADFMRQVHPTLLTAYKIGGDRFHLNGEYSGGYRVVVTMMNDNDTKLTFDDAFIRFVSATPETLARRGSTQVPTSLVNADGAVNPANRLSEQELYRSFLGFKKGALKPGDIIETWGKASFFGGNPEFVDQEGIYANGVEFKIVGHDDSLAKPVYKASISAFLNDDNKNHYVEFLAKKATADTVTDQFSQSLKIWDATGYAAKVLPGNVGDTLVISGVVTMESYGFRFRSDTAAVSTKTLPTVTNVKSYVNQLGGTVSAPITLSATASLNGGSYFLTPVADAQVASGNPAFNYGTNSNLYIQSSSTSSFGNERGLLKFDLSGIPAGTTISSASLQLWNWKSTGAALPVQVVGVATDTWTETGVNWNTQPTLGSVLDTQTLAAGNINLWYNWNVTSFVQTELNGDKTVSLAVKPVTEGSADATAPSYGFDSKEYGSNMPVLQVTAQTTATSVAGVTYFYRYSADNTTWGAWTQLGGANTSSPSYNTAFSFPSGFGYYEFYSVATDNASVAESTPAFAQTAVHYQAATGDTQTVSFTQPGSVTSGSNVTLAATASSGLSVSYTSLTPLICSVSGNVVSTIATGTCTIVANQIGDLGYILANSATQSFTVTAASVPATGSTSVPLPTWALIALAAGLMGTMRRLMSRRR